MNLKKQDWKQEDHLGSYCNCSNQSWWSLREGNDRRTGVRDIVEEFGDKEKISQTFSVGARRRKYSRKTSLCLNGRLEGWPHWWKQNTEGGTSLLEKMVISLWKCWVWRTWKTSSNAWSTACGTIITKLGKVGVGSHEYAGSSWIREELESCEKQSSKDQVHKWR